MMAGAGASPYELASDAASRLGIAVGAEELAALASDLDLGDGEMAAVAATFSYLAEKRRLASIETLLRLSRLPRRAAQDLRGLRLLQDPGPGRGRAGQAPVAGRPLRAPQRRLRRARRHREDAPRAGLRARVLHAGAQDLLHQGDRAQGQVPEGRPAGKHLAGRLLARQAVVPHC